jgi:hypothetical protein
VDISDGPDAVFFCGCDGGLGGLLKHLSVVFFSTILSLGVAHAQYTIETAAGGGPNNIPAVGANSNQPNHMTLANGALYIADSGESRVFKVDGTGTITVVAGSGFSDSRGGVPNGDGGLAIHANLVGPSGVAVDGLGNLYIVTSEGVRMVDTSGIITTLGTGCYSGNYGPTPIAVNQAGTMLYCVPGYGTTNGGGPSNVVYAFNLSTQTVTTFAGGGSFVADGVAPTAELLTAVRGLALDGAGNLFIADSGSGQPNGPAFVFEVSGGLISHIAGGGSGYTDGSLATAVSLPGTTDVAVDSMGDIFITGGYSLVYRIDGAAHTITKLAGGGSCPNAPYLNDGGPALNACMNPVGLAVDSLNNLYVSDYYPPTGGGNHLVRQISPAYPNIIETYVGNVVPQGICCLNGGSFFGGGYPGFSGNSYAATDARIGLGLGGVAIDPSGNLFIGDTNNGAVRRVDATTKTITDIPPVPGYAGPSPYDLAAGPDGTVYVNDSEYYIESIVGTTISLIATGGSSYTPDGATVPITSIGGPGGLAVDGAGNLYIADGTFCTIRKISGGILSTVAGIHGNCAIGGDGGPAASATLAHPSALASDTAGNLWIIDSGTLRRISADRTLITTVLPGGLSGSSGAIAVDAHGNALTAGSVAPCPSFCLMQVSPGGSVTILAGGNTGYGSYPATGNVFETPDGSPALGAVLRGISGIATNANGQIFFTENNVGYGGSVVRRLDPVNAPTATAASSVAATFGPSSQNVTLTANVTSESTVNGGTVAFTVAGIGGPLTSATVSGGSASAAFTIPGGTHPGVYAIQAVYSGVTGFASSSDATQSLTIQAATPIVTWAAPAAITFGSALGSTQLNATANIPGTLIYNPPVGTVLAVSGGQTLSVIFNPTDTTDYTTATASTTITVNPAAPPASPADLVVTKVLTRSSGNVVAQLTIANTGGTAAANVVLNSVKVGSDSAALLPQTIGTIAAGASAQATVTVPGSVGTSGAASSLTLSGTYTGGTFSSSARITLP